MFHYRDRFRRSVDTGSELRFHWYPNGTLASIRQANARVLDYKDLKTPQTKTLAQFLSSLNLTGKRVLFLAEKGDTDYTTLSKNLRNLPKVQFTHLPNVNGYDLALCQEIVILSSALDGLKETLGGSKK